MKITKCNLCKKINKERNNFENKWIHVSSWGGGGSFDFDLCERCSKGFIKFIQKYLKIGE